MALVPGLTREEETGASVGERNRKQSRTPVKESQAQKTLRPSETPGQYYNRPARPTGGKKSEQFAAALGKSSEVGFKLADHLAEKKRKEAYSDAQSEIQKMSLDEAKQKVESGELSQYDNPYFQEAFQRQYGIRLGLHRGREMKNKFETGFNPRTDDVDEFIDSHLSSDTERMGDNPLIRDAFVETVQEDVTRLRDKASTETAAVIEQDKLDGAFETMVANLDKPLDNASTPEERQQAIDQGYQAIRAGQSERRELLGLSNSEQDALTMQVAAKFAREGQVDVVEKLLTDSRGGIGAILDKRGQMGADAAQVLNQAEQAFEDDNREKSFEQFMGFSDQAEDGSLDRDELIEYHEQNPGVYSRTQITSLIRRNEAAQDAKREALREGKLTRKLEGEQAKNQREIVDDTLIAMRKGTTHRLEPRAMATDIDPDTGEMQYEMLTPEEQMEEAATVLQNRTIPEYASQFPEEEQGMRAFQYEVGIYAANSEMENKGWKRTLGGIQSAFTPQAATGEVPPKIRDGYALYKNLKAIAPGMLDSLISEKEIDTYEALRMSEQYMGLELDQAVQQVYQIQQNQDGDNKFSGTQYQEMDRAIQSLNGLGDGWGMPKNDGYITSELSKLARHQTMASGTSSVDSVVDRFKAEHEFINGWAVATRGHNVPVGFKGLAEAKINQYAADHQTELNEKGLEAQDLSLFPMGGQGSTGAWAIVDNTTANPMNDMIGSQFTMSELKRDAEEAREQKAADAADRSRRGVPNASMEADPENPRLQNLEEGYSPDANSGGGFDTNAARDRLLNPDSESSEAAAQDDSGATGVITGDDSVNDIDMSNAKRVSGSEPRNEDLPAAESIAKAKLSDNEDPQVKEAVRIAREAGMTKPQFDQYIKTIGQDGAGNAMIFNPHLRERIRYYLPSA